MEIYEILVPCNFQDTGKPVRTKHHKEWDKYVRNISGGLTVMKPGTGQWIYQNQLYTDRIIPVRIACTEKQIKQIANFTLTHYRQLAVMAYRISDKVIIIEKDN